MATYAINGSDFVVDDSLQGEALTKVLQQTADYTANQNQQKFLAFLGKSEGAGYDTIVGNRMKVTDYAAHPNVVGMRTANGPSTAAGKYQITGTTWMGNQAEAGVSDFSPASQDKVALQLISKRGALDDVRAGNFNAAIGKLGKEWASLPSSTYGQTHRSQAWVDNELNQPLTPPAAQSTDTPAGPGYVPFGTVTKNIDQTALNTNADWLKASRQVYQFKERKSFTGTDNDLAEWGKSVMGYFNNNVVDMTATAAGLVGHGTQDDKSAFVHMMDQYDETKTSWAGAGRAALGMVTDPTNLIGLGTMGVATAGKIAASVAAKGALKTTLTSLGRTGLQMGVLGGIQGGVTDTIKQGVEVTAGRKDGVGLGEVALHTGIGAVAGVVLGTAADALLTVAIPATQKVIGKIAGLVRKDEIKVEVPSIHTAPEAPIAGGPKEAPKVEPIPAQGETPGVAPDARTAPPEASATLPIATTLTEDELQAAGTRAQKGRLWTDDMPQPVGPLDGRVASTLVIPHSEPGLRATQRNMEKLTADGEVVAAQLRDLPQSTLRQTLEILRNSTTLQDAPVVFRAVQILHDEGRVALAEVIKELQTKTGDLTALIAKKEGMEDRLIHIQLADDAMGSFGGSLNRQRLEGLLGMQGSTVDSLMREMGLNRAEAEKFWQDMVDASQVSNKAKEIAADYEKRVAAALDVGDIGEVAKLQIMKGRELAGVAEEAAPGGSTWKNRLHTFAGGLKEFMISNVFALKTLLINAFPAGVKSLTLPFAKYLVTNPLERSAVAEMGAHYAAMGATVRGAFAAAHVAFKYEQSILTRDASKLLEGEMVMTGKLGGGLRFFPRVLNATDEFLAHINYAGFVAGKAANEAAITGAAKGLEGRALTDAIADAVKVAKANMYETADEAMIQPIINKGVNLGLSGDALVKYASEEAVKSAGALKHGSDKEGLDFVRDVLYKRAFSGKDALLGASDAAKSYETMIHKNPSYALLIGQLFFRTPIRVFEEGIRMTPGVQLLAPRFLSDLRGTNGVARQVRAQAESMVGLGVTGAALSLYAAGNITGSGSYNNYKQDKTRKDGPAPEPYTIKFPDGSTWSYKNLDPIAIPLKVLINAFEGMDELHIKEAQEGFENKPAYRLLMARVFVATAAVTSAITDANLVSGLKGSVDFLAELGDPENREEKILKHVGTELAMLVPNTLHKLAQMNDPRMRDPSTFFQVIEAKLGHGMTGPDGSKSSFAYDPLGQVRQVADIGSMWNIFSTASTEERIRGNTEAHQKVMLEFDRLAQETGAVFTAPAPKHPMTGDLDLRTMMTKDGTETMFDRWQRNYRDLNPDQVLLPIAESGASRGTFKVQGLKTEMLQKEMKSLQNIAFEQLLADERIRDRLILTAKTKARAQAGLLDFGNVDK